MRDRGSRRIRSRWSEWHNPARVLLLVPFFTGCIWNAFGECDHSNRELDADEAVNGVSPDGILSPLFTVHEGVLTWSETGATTPLVLTVSHAQPSLYVTEDCPQHDDHRFRVFGRYTAVSGDGLVDAGSDFYLVLDERGRLESMPEFNLAIRYEDLRAAAVGHPNVTAGPSVEGVVRVDPATLLPLETPLSIELPSIDEYPLGTVTWGEPRE